MSTARLNIPVQDRRSAAELEEDRLLNELEETRGELECWKTVPEFKGRYEVSSFGRLLNAKTGRVVRGSWNMRFGKRGRSVASMVAEMFCGQPPGTRALHRDHDLKNNFWKNLHFAVRKVPVAAQRAIARRARLGEKHIAIAIDLGISEDAVGVWARKAKVSCRRLHRVLTRKERRELIRRVEAGETYAAIALDLKIASRTVGVRYRAGSRKKSPRYRTDVSKATRLEIAGRSHFGEGTTELARAYGITREHVRAIALAAQKRGLLPELVAEPTPELVSS